MTLQVRFALERSAAYGTLVRAQLEMHFLDVLRKVVGAVGICVQDRVNHHDTAPGCILTKPAVLVLAWVAFVLAVDVSLPVAREFTFRVYARI